MENTKSFYSSQKTLKKNEKVFAYRFEVIYDEDMKYTVIADTCCSLFPKDIKSPKIDFHVVPLTLIVDDKEYLDDEKLDTAKFISIMNASKNAARSACPSPEAFYEIMEKSDNIIVVALSSKLSGTHASAVQAAELTKKNFPNKKVFVYDTLSAAAGLDFICLRLCEAIESDSVKSFDEATAKLEEICKKTRVRFLLQDLGNLAKNGRLSKMASKVLTTVKIKLICGDDGNGEIKKYGMAIGTRRGLNNLAELPAKEIEKDMPIIIRHVHNKEDADYLLDVLKSKHGFKNIDVRLMRGLSSLYAADKGIVIAY